MRTEQLRSTPSFSQFDPRVIPWQERVIDDIFNKFDYSLGTHEVLLSGSVGSAKSTLAAHCAVRHLLTFPGARCILGRKSFPALRDTIFTKIVEHLHDTRLTDGKPFVEGVDYFVAWNTCKIWFKNGSEILSRSWSDRNYKKLGSIEASIAIIEEATEGDAQDEMALKYIRMRVGRLPHIKQNWIMLCANPDGPSHYLYDYFQIGQRQQNGI